MDVRTQIAEARKSTLEKDGATTTGAAAATDGDSWLPPPRENLDEPDDEETEGTQDEEDAIQTLWPKVGQRR